MPGNIWEHPDPVPAPLAGAVAPAASFRACHHSIPFEDGLHDLRERKVACEGMFDQWQVVQQVRFVPIRTVQAHDRGSEGAWRARTSGETVGRTRDARPVPCEGRTCETDPNVREFPVLTCTSETAYVVVLIVVVPRPPGRLRRAGTGGRGRSDPPFSMPAVASGRVGMCTPSQPPWGSLRASNPLREGHRSAVTDAVLTPRGCLVRPTPSGHGFALARSVGPAAVGRAAGYHTEAARLGHTSRKERG